MERTVWHYTSLSSAASMIHSGELWAHRASEMLVDTQEVTYGLDRLHYYALEEHPNYLPSDFRGLLRSALDSATAGALSETTYIFCATTLADSASHWAAFGPAEVAVGLDTTPRVLRNRDRGWLSPVIGWCPVAYGDDWQRQLVQSQVGNLARQSELAAAYPGHNVWSTYANLSPDQILGALSPLVCTFKRPSYSNEAEYRYLDLVASSDRASEREEGGRVRHFTRVHPTSGRLPITQIQFAAGLRREQRQVLETSLAAAGYVDVALSVASNG